MNLYMTVLRQKIFARTAMLLLKKIKEELMPIAWHPSRYWHWCMSEDEKKKQENVFLTTWYAEIKNVLIKEYVEIWSKRGYN